MLLLTDTSDLCALAVMLAATAVVGFVVVPLVSAVTDVALAAALDTVSGALLLDVASVCAFADAATLTDVAEAAATKLVLAAPTVDALSFKPVDAVDFADAEIAIGAVLVSVAVAATVVAAAEAVDSVFGSADTLVLSAAETTEEALAAEADTCDFCSLDFVDNAAVVTSSSCSPEEIELLCKLEIEPLVTELAAVTEFALLKDLVDADSAETPAEETAVIDSVPEAVETCVFVDAVTAMLLTLAKNVLGPKVPVSSLSDELAETVDAVADGSTDSVSVDDADA
ncbi:hypothetical protein HDU83_002803 [Entophlyctis luteolus]|nr:hypothetical protein HDU83_002803 [Entophlyctis luteolus]